MATLRELGFSNLNANELALQGSSGNVETAITILLSQSENHSAPLEELERGASQAQQGQQQQQRHRQHDSSRPSGIPVLESTATLIEDEDVRN